MSTEYNDDYIRMSKYMKYRLYIAIDLCATKKNELTSYIVEPSWPPLKSNHLVRCSGPDRNHITIKLLYKGHPLYNGLNVYTSPMMSAIYWVSLYTGVAQSTY